MNRAMPSRHKQRRYNRGAGCRRQPVLRPIELPLPPETIEEMREYLHLHEIKQRLILQAFGVPPSALQPVPTRAQEVGKSPVERMYEDYQRLKALEEKTAATLGVYSDEVLDEGLPRIPAMEQAIETMDSKLQEILSWTQAYPVDIFPEMEKADWEKVRELLEAGGYTLDRISASNMRHVITEVDRIAREGLAALQKDGAK